MYGFVYGLLAVLCFAVVVVVSAYAKKVGYAKIAAVVIVFSALGGVFVTLLTLTMNA